LFQGSEKDKVEKKQKDHREDNLQDTLALTLRRLENTLKEFQILHFNLSSARIFFQA